jgi:hypothetical protein
MMKRVGAAFVPFNSKNSMLITAANKAIGKE